MEIAIATLVVNTIGTIIAAIALAYMIKKN